MVDLFSQKCSKTLNHPRYADSQETAWHCTLLSNTVLKSQCKTEQWGGIQVTCF